MEKLGTGFDVERPCPFLDEPDAEMDVSQQAAFSGLMEAGARFELDRPAEIVEQRSGKEEVRP